jgi:exosortase
MSVAATEVDQSSVLERLGTKNLLIFGVILAAILAVFFPTLGKLSQRWNSDPQYSHGYLVPFFSLFLAWSRRATLPTSGLRLRFLGFALVGVAVGLKIAAETANFDLLEDSSLVLAIAGATLASFGWEVFRWALAPLLFLLLMVPLPDAVSKFARKPLRRLGTLAGVVLMQVMGLAAFASGNTIELANGSRVGVAEACSGLRMLMVFVALAVAMALLSERPIWERLLLVVSSVPIALISNILRIVATGVLYSQVEDEGVREMAHDVFGWAMMPLGLVLLMGVSWILSHLLIVEQDRPLTVDPRLARAR